MSTISGHILSIFLFDIISLSLTYLYAHIFQFAPFHVLILLLIFYFLSIQSEVAAAVMQLSIQILVSSPLL